MGGTNLRLPPCRRRRRPGCRLRHLRRSGIGRSHLPRRSSLPPSLSMLWCSRRCRTVRSVPPISNCRRLRTSSCCFVHRRHVVVVVVADGSMNELRYVQTSTSVSSRLCILAHSQCSPSCHVMPCHVMWMIIGWSLDDHWMIIG